MRTQSFIVAIMSAWMITKLSAQEFSFSFITSNLQEIEPIEIDWIFGFIFDPLTAVDGQTINFNYQEGVHDVVRMTNKSAFDDCTFTVADETLPGITSNPGTVISSYTFTQEERGSVLYFACSIRNHCAGSMKLQINVL
jgi:hypothetical protein